MNNLNSVLIEGTVSGGIAIVKAGVSEVRCSFAISNFRYFMCGKSKKEQRTRVRIMIRNVKLAEVVKTKARDGCGVRVVGRLAEDNSGIYIEAEHIEFRPEPKGAK